MKIKRIQIRQFGKLNNWDAKLGEGLTIIYGPNESGKSTLHSFIRGMIFGVPRYRGRAAKTDPYTRYEPWESPFSYGGSMTMEVGEKEFLLTRSFYKNDLRAALSCITDGEELSVADGDLNMLLGNIGESIYDNTVSIGQLGSSTDEGLAQQLQRYMANLEDSGSGTVDITKAKENLRKKRKDWEAKERESLAKEEEQRQILKRQCQYVEQEREKLEAELKKVGQDCENLEMERNPHSLVTGILAVLGFLALFAAPAFSPFGRAISWTIGIVLWAILILAAIWYYRKGQTHTAHGPALKGKQELLLSQLQEKETEVSNLKENLEEAVFLSGETEACRVEIESLNLALHTLDELAGQMKLRIGERLKHRTGEVLSEITGGKYSQLSMDEDMKIHIRKDNRQIPLYQLSRGTIEQVYFSLRIAASEILCEEPMPLLLDDVFAMYDEERLGQTLAWLANRKGQTLLFTCHRREAQLAEKLGLPFHLRTL